MVELNIIKILLYNNNYNKYYNYIYNNNYLDNIKINNKYIYKILLSLKELKEDSNKDHSIDDLINIFYSLYPATTVADKEIYDDLFERIRSSTASEDTAQTLLESLREVFIARELSTHALDVSEARRPFKSLLERFQELVDEKPVTSEGVLYKPDLCAILDSKGVGKGLEWPLICLNKSIGPLHKGDFGWIFARPEVGKTALLVSIVCNALKQTTGNILWVNNEEATQNVYLRCFYNIFNCTRNDLVANMEYYQRESAKVGINRIQFCDDAAITKRDIEALIKNLEPELIVIDQLDKVHGFYNSTDYPLLMKIKYQWARETAKKWCPVIGTCQAGGQAEGKTWLDLDDADYSKTGKQGEADWIIGVGVNTNIGFENMRYLNVLKNKLGNGDNCDEQLRHGKFRTELDFKFSKYKDTDYR